MPQIMLMWYSTPHVVAMGGAHSIVERTSYMTSSATELVIDVGQNVPGALAIAIELERLYGRGVIEQLVSLGLVGELLDSYAGQLFCCPVGIMDRVRGGQAAQWVISHYQTTIREHHEDASREMSPSQRRWADSEAIRQLADFTVCYPTEGAALWLELRPPATLHPSHAPEPPHTSELLTA